MTRNRRPGGDVEHGVRFLVAMGTLALTLSACGTGPASPPFAGAKPPAASASVPASASASAPASAPAATPGAGPTLIAFALVPTAGTGAAAEISAPDQLDRLVGATPEAAGPAREAVARHSGAGNRLFAFVLSGCRNTGATLAIGAGRITATLTGGEGTACFAAELYLAVFAVPAYRVPPGTRVG